MLKNFIYLGLCVINAYAVLDDSQNARILSYNFENDGLGPYQYSFESSDKIKREESGELTPSIHDESEEVLTVKGSYSYTGPDGVKYTVKYVADESGFHPEGDHISVPPFVPWKKGQPVDDGQYRPDNSGKYIPDDSGKYDPENEGSNVLSDYEQPKRTQPVVSGERILSEYLTTPRSKPDIQKYFPAATGDRVTSDYLTTPAPPADVTQKYLPPPPSPLLIGEEVSGDYHQQNADLQPTTTSESIPQQNSATTEYYPPPAATQSPPQITREQLIQNAYYGQPQPHPDILLHSKPYSAESSKLSPVSVPRPFAMASQNVPISVPYPDEKAFSYMDLNPAIREIINSI